MKSEKAKRNITLISIIITLLCLAAGIFYQPICNWLHWLEDGLERLEYVGRNG